MWSMVIVAAKNIQIMEIFLYKYRDMIYIVGHSIITRGKKKRVVSSSE